MIKCNVATVNGGSLSDNFGCSTPCNSPGEIGIFHRVFGIFRRVLSFSTGLCLFFHRVVAFFTGLCLLFMGLCRAGARHAMTNGHSLAIFSLSSFSKHLGAQSSQSNHFRMSFPLEVFKLGITIVLLGVVKVSV